MNLHVNLIFFQLNKTVNQIATYQKPYNVRSENKYTKRSSDTLLRLVYLFSERTLCMRYVLYDVGISAVVCIIFFRLPEKANPLYSKLLTYIPKYVIIDSYGIYIIKSGVCLFVDTIMS